MSRLTDYLIVVSFDCLSALDFPILESLPNFSTFIKSASYCTQVQPIYPTVTYPSHTSIITGKFPKRHGVVNNTLIQPGRTSPDWFWHRYNIKSTTVYDEAKKSGLTTAALLWPVTAKAKIDYNMPEIFANRPWQHQVLVSLLNGTSRFQLDMNRRFGHIRKGLSQPELDDFVLESTVHTIKTKQPNLLLVHFTDLDTQRHYHGFSSEEAMNALTRHDERLGRIMTALTESGLDDKSTVVLLGDHSALDESKVVKLNVLLRERHLIRLSNDGRVEDWKAYCKSCDGSAYVYLRNQEDEQTRSIVAELLQTLANDERNGIEKVLTGAEAADMGADDECAFMIEAHRGFYFHENLDGDFIDDISPEDIKEKRYTIASHGYSPSKENYNTVFIARGRGIRENTVIPAMKLVDEGPTFAHLLGLDLGDTDGTVLEELLEQRV